jgi:heat shock protein HslJ
VVRVALLLLTFVALVACKKDNNQNDTIFGKWKVEGFVADGSSISKTTEANIYVTFNNNKSVDIQLDVNSCFSTFTIESSNITIASLGCTEACCDSEFSQELAGLLSIVKTYHFTSGKLNLAGDDNLNIRLNKE